MLEIMILCGGTFFGLLFGVYVLNAMAKNGSPRLA